MIRERLRVAFLQAFFILLICALTATVYNSLSSPGVSWVKVGQPDKPGENSSDVISLEKAHLLFDQGKALFLDARDEASFHEGHVKGALNIRTETISANLSILRSFSESDISLIAYCDGPQCPLGRQLASALRKQKIKNVKIMLQGWSAWLRAGYPIGP